MFAEDGAECSEEVADTESCWLSLNSDEVTGESGGASDAGAVTASSLTALDVVVVSSTAAVCAVRSRVVVASVGSEADLVWVSSPPTTARFAPVRDAGRAEFEVERDGELDADDPDDRDADDFTEPKDRDVDTDSGDADELVEGDPEEPSEDDAGPSEADTESFGAAEATPCPPNTAAPNPRATASPPTLPTYAAALNSFTFLGMLRDRTNMVAVTGPNSEQNHAR